MPGGFVVELEDEEDDHTDGHADINEEEIIDGIIITDLFNKVYRKLLITDRKIID